MNINDNNNLISKFNSSSDYGILLLINGDNLSAKEKRYLIENCQNRIEQMDINIFIQTLRQTDYNFCEELSQYLSLKIPTLTISQIEDLLYTNKYYHAVSEIASFLVKQNWFINKGNTDYKCFFTAFELEKMLQLDFVSEEKIQAIGSDIIDLLTANKGSSLLFDMIIKNYLSLLQKYAPQYFEYFKNQGYETINRQIAEEKEQLRINIEGLQIDSHEKNMENSL